MFSKTRNIIFVWRIVLALFVFSSSGFTMIIEKCTMSNDASCCSASVLSACGKNNSSHLPVLKKNALPCMITALAGKLSTMQAISEQSQAKEQFFTSAPLLIFSFSLSPSENFRTLFPTNKKQNNFSSVEKYVLFSTYLI